VACARQPRPCWQVQLPPRALTNTPHVSALHTPPPSTTTLQAQYAAKSQELAQLQKEVNDYTAHHSIQELEALRNYVSVCGCMGVSVCGWRGVCRAHCGAGQGGDTPACDAKGGGGRGEAQLTPHQQQPQQQGRERPPLRVHAAASGVHAAARRGCAPRHRCRRRRCPRRHRLPPRRSALTRRALPAAARTSSRSRKSECHTLGEGGGGADVVLPTGGRCTLL
jgi:hypothetical protein